jgi:hypothetical protein
MSGEMPARNSVRRFSSSVGIVEAGNQQRDDFEPQAHGVDAANAFENGADAAAEFVVVAVVEALEIDFVEIEPGAHVFENLRRAVAVGDEAGDESAALASLKTATAHSLVISGSL